MYKQTISIEAQLKKIADEKPEYGELWSTWNLNKKKMEPILNAIIKDYPHYSLHDYSHSESVLLNIEKILGNEDIVKLSPTDLWLLLHTAYLHDFGMVILDTKIQEFWKSDAFQEYLREQIEYGDEEFKRAAELIVSANKEREEVSILWPLEIKKAVTLLISKYCRWQHGNFSRDYILDTDNVWGIDFGHSGLIKNRLVSLIADISAIHTKPFAKLFDLHKETNGYKGDYAHPRLVASLLRLGDVLDLDNGRFNYCGEKIFGTMPKDSKVHYGKHEATKHILINSNVIEVEADCSSDTVYRETRRWYDLLKNEIESMHLNWSDIATPEFGYPPRLMPYKILRNGIKDTHSLSDLRFAISQSKAFEILEGASIYKYKYSCLREIVQNAEDATKIQLWRDIKSGLYYSENGINKSKVEDGSLLPNDIPEWVYKIYAIKISIERTEDNNALISVMDHGTGISLDDLKNICNVGQSYFQKKDRSKEIEEMPVWLKPTASFGVGLQSCFMLTDKIFVDTNSNQDGMYKIIFKSGKQEGYVNVEPLERRLARGSNVYFEVKNELNFSYNILGYTAEQLKKIEPFESNCIIIYKIIESIFQECDSSFFDINVTSTSVKFFDVIGANMTDKNDFPTVLGERGMIYSLNENKDMIKCWYNNNLYQIRFNKQSMGILNIRFKGKHVKKNRINNFGYIGLNIEVDIYGLPTKETLSLNREELLFKASNIIREEIDDVVRMYFNMLIEDRENIKGNTELVDACLLNFWIFDKKFPEDLCEFTSTEKNIKIIKYNKSTDKYEVGKCSLRDIAKEFPEIFYVDRDIDDDNFISAGTLKEDGLVLLLNNGHFEKTKYERIIIDRNVKRFLRNGWRNTFYLNCSEIIEVCIINLDDMLYTPDEYTKHQIIQKLVYHNKKNTLYRNMFNIMRKTIPAFEEYSSLAVELGYVPLIGRDGMSKWNIISPISFEDNQYVNVYSKEAFVDYITTKPIFFNIVDYVIKHAKIKSSRENVVCDYRKLIGEYYDIEKENGTVIIH